MSHFVAISLFWTVAVQTFVDVLETPWLTWTGPVSNIPSQWLRSSEQRLRMDQSKVSTQAREALQPCPTLPCPSSRPIYVFRYRRGEMTSVSPLGGWRMQEPCWEELVLVYNPCWQTHPTLISRSYRQVQDLSYDASSAESAPIHVFDIQIVISRPVQAISQAR